VNIVLAYSSKEGLLKEYQHRYSFKKQELEIPPDFFAEGDSFETIQAVIDALKSNVHKVTGVEADDELFSRLESMKPELVFNIAEGLFGDFRESYVPLICERAGVPYTGSDPLTLAICLNKARTKEILSYFKVPNPLFKVFYPGQSIELKDFPFPAIIKPIAEGSSKGIFDDSVVDNKDDMKARIEEKMSVYNEPMMIEQYLEGREFTAALWGNGEDLEVLPIVAINFDELPEGARPIYSYEAKWIWDTTDKPLQIFQCPANLSNAEKNSIETIVKNAYRVLRIRDWCRIDVRMDKQGTPYILELNPLPGILPNPVDNSCFPKAARTAGYSYPKMINNVVDIARKRNGL
jgi:D-alanine-D-alanine ligase